jgi:hypothetical protein
MTVSGAAPPEIFRATGSGATPLASGLGGGRFRRAVGQRHDFVRRRPRRLARGVGIVRRPFPAGALAEHAAQPQENEYCERQKNNGVDVEHVSHAFGNRTGRLALSPINGVADRRAVLIYAGFRANP